MSAATAANAATADSEPATLGAPLVLPAELTHEQGAAAWSMLAQAVRAQARQGQAQQPVVVDGSHLQRFDSTALSIVLACRRAVLAQGQPFAVRGLPAHLDELAALYGVQDLLAAAEDPSRSSHTDAAAASA